ncbi:MAG: arylsulfatase [Candidatus Sumerlaeota bacterium]|nr:arylsulfatase [Candidatus Sumerlaeota bacterium]
MKTMDRGNFLKLAGLSTAGLAISRFGSAALSDASTLGSKRPNIILILTDDQGYGDLARNGNPVIKTPNLDRMYDESVHFEDFHVSPTCSPTRSSLMSGKHEFHNGVTHTINERERMSLKTTTIAQILKSAGYATGIFGKWHLGDEEPYQPNKRGFDEVFIHGAGGIGQSYPGTCGDAPGNKYFDPVIRHNGTFVKTQGYCTDIFFGQAMKWIGEAKGKQPFFVYITPNAPHGPLVCPEEYEKMYAGKVEGNVAKFLGMVTNIDDNVGKLLAKVKDLGIEKDTLVIFMNDNGGTGGVKVFNAGMAGQKGTARNGGTRAMSLWRWPGTLKPAACGQLTAHLDLYTTFAELSGAKVPADVASKLEGFSLLPLLENPNAPWHDDRMLFTHVGRWKPGGEPEKYGACSVRWRQYLYFPGDRKGQLFDLKTDPGEKTDIAAQHQDIVGRLAKAYDEWWIQTLPLLENEQAYQAAPKVNPYRELYFKQYKGPGPNNAAFNDALSQSSEASSSTAQPGAGKQPRRKAK